VTWWQRLWRRNELEQQLGKELQFHIEERVLALRQAGVSEREARRQARQEFGGVEPIKEACRDARGTLWIESSLKDLRYSARSLRKTPAFTLAAIATLALGIGANTAIFQLLDAVRLRSLPVVEPQKLARIQIANGHGFGVSHSRRVPVLRVSGEFFSTLGVPPAAGRLFRPEDDLRGCTGRCRRRARPLPGCRPQPGDSPFSHYRQ
jgi:hypothetical protein